MREALVPVYEALDLEWDPATAGSVTDEVGDVTLATVEDAILNALVDRYDLQEVGLDRTTLALAARLEPEHRLDS